MPLRWEGSSPDSSEHYALSGVLQVNLETGLEILMHSRAVWARELKFIERRKADGHVGY